MLNNIPKTAWRVITAPCVVILIVGSEAAMRLEAVSSVGRQPTPPPMPRRAIAPPQKPLPGESIVFDDKGSQFTLFLPDGWKVPSSGKCTLTIHFHSAIWHAIQEHLRRGLKGPLLCFYPGEGSSIYKQAFEDTSRLKRLMDKSVEEMIRRGAPAGTHITAVDISSFSAGYGAVREIVKSPEYFKILRRIVLCDSMYAANDPKASGHKPDPTQINPWIPLANAAIAGNKTFAFTHSEVPTGTYANSAACALAVIKAVGAPILKVTKGSLPAADDPEFPLLYRSDKGNFHIWGYGGIDGQAHMTHARHLGDVWMALDAAGCP